MNIFGRIGTVQVILAVSLLVAGSNASASEITAVDDPLTLGQKIALMEKYDYINTFCEGRAEVRIHDEEYGYLFGFIDENGNEVVEPILNYASDFENGMAIIEYGVFWGVIDKNGYILIEPEYNAVGGWHEGMMTVIKSGLSGFYNDKAELVVPLEYT